MCERFKKGCYTGGDFNPILRLKKISLAFSALSIKVQTKDKTMKEPQKKQRGPVALTRSPAFCLKFIYRYLLKAALMTHGMVILARVP